MCSICYLFAIAQTELSASPQTDFSVTCRSEFLELFVLRAAESSSGRQYASIRHHRHLQVFQQRYKLINTIRRFQVWNLFWQSRCPVRRNWANHAEVFCFSNLITIRGSKPSMIILRQRLEYKQGFTHLPSMAPEWMSGFQFGREFCNYCLFEQYVSPVSVLKGSSCLQIPKNYLGA